MIGLCFVRVCDCNEIPRRPKSKRCLLLLLLLLLLLPAIGPDPQETPDSYRGDLGCQELARELLKQLDDEKAKDPNADKKEARNREMAKAHAHQRLHDRIFPSGFINQRHASSLRNERRCDHPP